MAQEALKRKGGLAVLAGFCYLLLSVGAVVDFLYWMFSSAIPNWDYFVENSLFVSNIITDVVIIISFLVMAILMFIHKPAVVPGVGFILLAIGEFLYFFLSDIAAGFIYGVNTFFSRLFGSGWNIYNTLTAFAMVLIYLLMAILCFVGNNSFKVVRFIWFLPLILILLVLIIDAVALIIDFTRYGGSDFSYVYYEVSYILRRLFEMIAVMFASMWIGIATKKPEKRAPAPRPPVQRPVVQPRVNPAQQPYAATPQYRAPAQPYTPAPQPASYDAELTRLKKLLDDGVITEEEFAAKKKQILGL